MSFRSEQFLKFEPTKYTTHPVLATDLSNDEIEHLFLEVLNSGLHGLCFSLYEEGQKPGDFISEAQIRRRLRILSPYTKWVRSFSTTESNDLIPKIAKEFGLKTLVGAWLGRDRKKNEEEIESLIDLSKNGYVDIAAIGNEVLYRGDLSLEELKNQIIKVKSQIPNIEVGYVDAYYEFVQHPDLTALCDVVLSNCYPFWEGTRFEDALGHVQYMYSQSKEAAQGKRVIITETGWPSKGEKLGLAQPNKLNAMKYFINTQLWTADDRIEMFYFSSFDEDWKQGAEGEVGAYWGIWDKYEKVKYI